jgi:hypothetical protein
MADSPQSKNLIRTAWFWPVLVAAAIRIPVACVADDQWGDAPIRFDLLQRWTQHPGLWWSFDRIFQYGPLPTHLAGLLSLTGLGPALAARVVVVLAGVVGVGLLAALAARFGGARAGLAAGLALALSPLHIQASTTFTSEALYVALVLGCLTRAFDRDPWGMVICAFGASTTRYDTWIWLPLLAAWWLWREWPKQRWTAFVAPVLLMAGPLSILLANQLALGNAFAPLAYISKDHVALAADAQVRVGSTLWRSLMTMYWPAAFLAVLTPGFALVAFWSLAQQIRERSQALMPAALGTFPPLLYTFKSVVLANFWPMARFALGPATLVMIGMKGIGRTALMVCVAISLAYNGALIALGDGQPGIGLLAAAASPVSLLPADLRAGARWLRETPGLPVVDFSPYYDDILVIHGAGRLFERYQLLNPPAGSAPRRIFALTGCKLDLELKPAGRAFGHTYKVVFTQGRVTVWELTA